MCGPLFYPYGVDENEVDLFVIYVLANGDDKTLESCAVQIYYGNGWLWACDCEGIWGVEGEWELMVMLIIVYSLLGTTREVSSLFV